MTNLAIQARGIGKSYRLGARPEVYGNWRQALGRAAARPVRRLRSALGGASATESGGAIWALREVSFDVGAGEVLGVIGRNGAGKSTLLKLLSRITEPTEGRAEIHGRVASLLEVGTGFHPELTGRENVYLNGAILGMRRMEIRRKFDEIVAFAEVERFLDTQVKHYSSGMYLRLAFAVAAHLEPEVLLVDEVLAVGDAAFQRKCLGKMSDVARLGRTVLFVSHNLAAISRLCDRCLLIEGGRLARDGTPSEAIRAYAGLLGRDRDAARSQSGALGLRNLAMEPVDGAGSGAPGALEAGRACRARFELSVRRELVAVSLRLSLRDGEDRLALHVRLDGETTAPLRTPGDHTVTAELPPLWLAPGPYTLTVKAIGDQLGRSKERCVSDPLMVEAINPEIGDLAAPGLLRPACTWRLERKA